MRYTLQQIKDGTGWDPNAKFEYAEDYNGWTNRETWAVALHINNDQGWQESVLEALRSHRYDNDPDNDLDLDTMTPYGAGEIIRENVDEWIEYLTTRDTPEAAGDLWGLVGDIGSLWRVNWTELGASFLEDIED